MEFIIKVKDIITIDRASNAVSTGYCVSLVKLEKLALLETSYTPPAPGHPGAPGTKHFTFQAITAGKAAPYGEWKIEN
jgi:predicted secreted protein